MATAIGSSIRPVYVDKNGVPKPCSKDLHEKTTVIVTDLGDPDSDLLAIITVDKGLSTEKVYNIHDVKDDMIKVVFKDEVTNEVIETKSVYSGSDAVPPTAPDHTTDGYTFSKWDGTYKAVTENSVVWARYNQAKYTVTFRMLKDGSYTTLATRTNVAHGSSVTAPSTPDYSGYSKGSWDQDFSCVTKNMTVTIAYTKDGYLIIFQNDDLTELENGAWAYGATPTYGGAIPIKPNPETGKDYSFKDWNPTIVPVTCSTTYTATYNWSWKKYTVTFKLNGGSLSGSTADVVKPNIEYGSSFDPLKPGTPTKDGYTFKGWSDPTSGMDTSRKVIGDCLSDAQYEAIVIQYTVSFYNRSCAPSAMIQSNTVDSGSAMPYCIPPSQPDNPITGKIYTSFKEWLDTTTHTAIPTTVTKSANYYATFNERDYRVVGAFGSHGAAGDNSDTDYAFQYYSGYSTNSWERNTSDKMICSPSVAWSGNRFIKTSYDSTSEPYLLSVKYSDDGYTWKDSTTKLQHQTHCCGGMWNGSRRFVLLCNPHTIGSVGGDYVGPWYSDDGDTWIRSYKGSATARFTRYDSMCDCCYGKINGNDVFLASFACGCGVLYRSINGGVNFISVKDLSSSSSSSEQMTTCSIVDDLIVWGGPAKTDLGGGVSAYCLKLYIGTTDPDTNKISWTTVSDPRSKTSASSTTSNHIQLSYYSLFHCWIVKRNGICVLICDDTIYVEMENEVRFKYWLKVMELPSNLHAGGLTFAVDRFFVATMVSDQKSMHDYSSNIGPVYSSTDGVTWTTSSQSVPSCTKLAAEGTIQ